MVEVCDFMCVCVCVCVVLCVCECVCVCVRVCVYVTTILPASWSSHTPGKREGYCHMLMFYVCGRGGGGL